MRKREIETNHENFCPQVEAKTIGGTSINSLREGCKYLTQTNIMCGKPCM